MKRKGIGKRSKVGRQTQKFMETPGLDLLHPLTQSPRKVVLQNTAINSDYMIMNLPSSDLKIWFTVSLGKERPKEVGGGSRYLMN